MRFVRMLVMGVAVLGFMAMSAQAGTIDLIVNAYATQPDMSMVPIPTKVGDMNPTGVQPGSIITYEVAFVVDDSAGSTAPGNLGLATIVFSVLNAGDCSGYQMPFMEAAESGYDSILSSLRDVTQPMYVDTSSSVILGYNGGWGFDNSGLPIGGNVTETLCEVHGAGSLDPLTWTADVNPLYPGLQPYARLGVGLGTYTFPAEDPVVGGMQGGFGQQITNTSNLVPGDGHWLMFRSTIDTSGWAEGGTYGWNLTPSNGAVFSPTLDYNQDIGTGFRIAVYAEDMAGDSFSFFLIPEPASLGLLLIGSLALIRRRP